MINELAKKIAEELSNISINNINSVWLTIEQAVAYSKISHHIIRKFINNGCLIAGGTDGKYLINKNHLDKQILLRFPKIDKNKLTPEEIMEFRIEEEFEKIKHDFEMETKYKNKKNMRVF